MMRWSACWATGTCLSDLLLVDLLTNYTQDVHSTTRTYCYPCICIRNINLLMRYLRSAVAYAHSAWEG